MPLIFTQDQLLTSAQFSREAEQIGIRVDEALLQALHSGRHLLPLFRIDDEAVVGRQLSIHQKVRQNSPRGWVLDAAREGRLRDPALEGYSVAWPYQRPDDVDPRQWWNGFVYSSWQLLDLADMSWELSTAKRDFWRDGTVRSSVSVDPPWSPAAAKQRRARTVTLAAIANRFLVNIVGHASLPAGESWNDLWQTADDLDLAAAVARVGVDPADLLPLAEQLLFSAHGHDPLRDWLPLVRWADYRAWDRLRGAAQLA
ncbi:MAG: hypothetical protein ACXVH7_13800, partial [Thermoanaerobaculia bacterium]